jgi:pyruvate ferredoxin oxidoreductase beta subunit
MLPKSCFDIPVLNCCFASAGATAAGISGALDVQIAKGAIAGPKPVVFNWIGDGGTYDIGFQGVSAAAERDDDFIHFCYNNEAYSNTGVQRSGATPRFASTTTTPAGKPENKKNLPLLMLEHGCAYVATASVAYPMDLYRKVAKARDIKGFRYIEVHAPCGPGWKFPSDQTVEIGRLAAMTGAWALWEAEYGDLTLSALTLQLAEGKAERARLEDYLKLQGRFDTVMKSPDKDDLIREMEQNIQKELNTLLSRGGRMQ